MKNLISILCMGLSMLSMGLYGKNKVSGDLRWGGTRPSSDRPVSLGIPFLKGELEADGRVGLKYGDGTDIPSDCWPLAYWPDGSVKWAGVAAVIPEEAEDIRFATILAIKEFKKGRTKKVIGSILVVPGYLVSLLFVMLGFNLIFVNSNELD